MVELDNVDRGILHELQLDARNRTAQEIADKVDVSASTVRNRIAELEADGIIEGYHPKLDYERASLPLQVLFVCSAPPTERSEIVEQILDIRGVVDVRETLTGRRNLYVEAVGTGTADTVRITDAMHNLGLSIESSEILRQRRVQPFNHFFFTDPYSGKDNDQDE
ncbi:putative transcriptional regulator, AsnC family [Haloterrigena turkmenica DSM 5511]|uniref:Transcriptional regulator, AsnC family n=1 Tax=Haloterrigena turkmenica (strain ATCC 51198 / DSM 5511 / JCM 9101 / NCIMB 13204 / VKM B-1734 / 4k) TaxID=543526 RepID=D2RXJ5_HALTV|nr:Lrp/AsnC family transcriptional regulator [Haloterrigena turkmenica]ADB61719.1 putative transcriptional regulator, AsnC family [Haloterrigena turkmenica DSM 5511]